MWETVSGYIDRISEYGWISVVIELTLIWLVLYAVWRFLQGTRGLRLMRGLIMTLVSAFLILEVLARTLELDRIHVLFSPLVYMIFFASLIAFQPELRRGFIRLGEARWLRSIFRESEETISPITAAVRYCSRHKIGALIAIERQVGLGAIVEAGVPVDSELNPEILKTIFWPGSALHDLGVIIQEGRIAAAACQFPLTESDTIDPSLGSRHRAAVGLTEDSDAIVIIVSEETGAISLAVEGKLIRGFTPQGLAEKLRELLRTPSKPKKQNKAISSGAREID